MADDLLPFTTQAQAYRHRDRLEAEQTVIVTRMRQLIAEFEAAVRAPRPLTLAQLNNRSGLVYLRWRRCDAQGRQAFVKLESPEVWTYVQNARAETLYRRFDDRAALLTYAFGVRAGELMRLGRYLESMVQRDRKIYENGIRVFYCAESPDGV